MLKSNKRPLSLEQSMKSDQELSIVVLGQKVAFSFYTMSLCVAIGRHCSSSCHLIEPNCVELNNKLALQLSRFVVKPALEHPDR